MPNSCRSFVVSALVLLTPLSAHGQPVPDAMKFFEGDTRSEGTLKVMFGKPRRSRSVGAGTIKPDGSLYLVQQIDDEGAPPHERRWHIRAVAPGHYSGIMSEASGQVTIDDVSGRYRLQFKMPGGLGVEQWLTPLPGGKSARSHLVVRKLGAVVAVGEGLITRLP